jgi:hypothetical protein
MESDPRRVRIREQTTESHSLVAAILEHSVDNCRVVSLVLEPRVVSCVLGDVSFAQGSCGLASNPLLFTMVSTTSGSTRKWSIFSFHPLICQCEPSWPIRPPLVANFHTRLCLIGSSPRGKGTATMVAHNLQLPLEGVTAHPRPTKRRYQIQ